MDALRTAVAALVPAFQDAAAGTFPDTLRLETKDDTGHTVYGAANPAAYTPVPGGLIRARVHPTRTEMVAKPDGSLIYVTRATFACAVTAPVAAGQSVLLGEDRYTLLNLDTVRAWAAERLVDCEKDTTTG